jgi:alpha-1,6-mannosyltransferase
MGFWSFWRWPAARLLALTGSVYLVAVLILLVSRTQLGTPLFYTLSIAMTLAYAVMLRRVWRDPPCEGRLLWIAFALAVAFRVPLALGPVAYDSDMIRYLWDGRVQRLGLNPYAVVPSDPTLAYTHTADSARMPSLRAKTPYGPAAQLFFRLSVSILDSARFMKIALVGCDLLTIVVIWRWLLVSQRNQWLALAYAWHPLVVLEVAHSGHIDAFGALWIAAAAYWLTRRRTMLAVIAFGLAVATKLLPIVLAPLFLGRVRVRDAVFGGLFLAILYIQFVDGTTLPLGAVPSVVAHIRFNGPVFRAIALSLSPEIAAVTAVVLGTVAAVVARVTLAESDPAAWAWPMAVALLCAPVIYPWYLLAFTPFLLSGGTLPLTVWGITALAPYIVWQLAKHGARWVVPPGVMLFEFAIPVLVSAVLVWRARRRKLSTGVEQTSPVV